jgi:hypothetical protein
MKEFKAFLSDLLTSVDPFKDVITHIMMRERDGKVIAIAKSRDGSISIQVKSRGEVPGYSHKACLGSLPYLRSALASAYMKEGTLELTTGESSRGNDEVLRSIKLKGSHGFNVFYQAVDPFVSKLSNVDTPKSTELNYPVAFAVDTKFIESFDEVYKVQQQAPKIGTDRDDIFTVSYNNSSVEAIFGEKGHQATVILTKTVEAATGVDKVNSLFSMTKFRSILKLVGKGTGIGSLSDKALRIDTETKQTEIQFVMSAKRVRD